MANMIPQCPKCHGTVTLAPILPGWNESGKDKCGNLPVSCMECKWVGTWKDVLYVVV